VTLTRARTGRTAALKPAAKISSQIARRARFVKVDFMLIGGRVFILRVEAIKVEGDDSLIGGVGFGRELEVILKSGSLAQFVGDF
jgi:hypothetical protein